MWGEGVHSVCISGYDCTSAVNCNQGGMAYILVFDSNFDTQWN